MLNIEIITATLLVGVMLNSINAFPYTLAINYDLEEPLVTAGFASLVISAMAGSLCIVAAGITLGGRKHIISSVTLGVAFFMLMINRVYANRLKDYYGATRGAGIILLAAAPLLFIQDHAALAVMATTTACIAGLLPPPINTDNQTTVSYPNDPALIAMTATITSILMVVSSR